MRVLVCGGRHFGRKYGDHELMARVLNEIDITEIIHGAARGADSMAGDWGHCSKLPVQAFPADWDTYGKRAGPIRNTQMLKEGKPDLVVAFIAPGSRGTKHMVEIAKKAGVPVKEINID
jgi:hypothetical protein